MVNLPHRYIGVDVSKDTLDIYIQPAGTCIKIANTESSINKFVKKSLLKSTDHVTCEATGGYEKLLQKILTQRGFSLWVVDPRRVRAFIIASGCKGKTDKIDAQKIAEFSAQNINKNLPLEVSPNHEQLQALVNRKGDLNKFLTAERTRLNHPSHIKSNSSIKRLMKVFEKEIKHIDKQIKKLVDLDPVYSKKAELLQSIPGIGQASAATLLAFVPELGKLSNKKISALVGVCPYNNESGKFRGKTFIRGGRAAPRNLLYMCALTATMHNPTLKIIYRKLIETKPFKVAIVVLMHKLIIYANSILKKEVSYVV